MMKKCRPPGIATSRFSLHIVAYRNCLAPTVHSILSAPPIRRIPVTVAATPKYAFVTMTVGTRAGEQFLLERDGPNRIGRGEDCRVVLADPLCSRVHAELQFREGRWWIEDCKSRNGTFVNSQKIDEPAMLDDGHSIRIGTVEFEFRQSDESPIPPEPEVETYTETIVRDAAVQIADTSIFGLAAVRDADQAKQLLVLYQLAIKLLGCDDDQPDDVVRIALDLLRDQTRAAVVGFLWVDDAGRLRPKVAIPEGSVETVNFSDSLTELVCRQGHAVWIAKQRGSTTQTDSLAHYADALCVPLISHRNTMGAIHAYLDQGRFRQADFEFSISLANILVVALVRAHKQTTLATEYQRLVDKSAYGELIGQCPAMQELKTKIGRMARATGSVLVRGESGSGKELVARALHKASPRGPPHAQRQLRRHPGRTDGKPALRPQSRRLHQRRARPHRLLPTSRQRHALLGRSQRAHP